MYRLHKSIYRLKQAPRTWFLRLSQALLALGFNGSTVDISLFTFHLNEIFVYVLIYIDNIIVASNSSSSINHLITYFSVEFVVKDHGPLSYFMGIQVTKTLEGIHLS